MWDTDKPLNWLSFPVQPLIRLLQNAGANSRNPGLFMASKMKVRGELRPLRVRKGLGWWRLPVVEFAG